MISITLYPNDIMTDSVLFSLSHSCVVGLSKPVMFTGASALFLLMYLMLWKYNDSYLQANLDEGVFPFSGENNGLSEKIVLCSINYQVENSYQVNNESDAPTIYFVTPTYARSVQIAELTRLGQTLVNVPSLHWILVEDSENCNPIIDNLLKRLGIPFTHMASAMPALYRMQEIQPRGVSNRRAALQWIRSHVQTGVLYFGDDDNTYDLRLFEEIRHTQKISMFPVGLVGDYAVSAPVVHDGKVVGFYDSWPAGRRFAVDMAGFAVNIKLLLLFPNATITYKAGYEEDYFLQALLVDSNQIEAKAENCTQILVWHTKTVQIAQPLLQRPKEESTVSSVHGLIDSLDKLKLAKFTNKGKPSTVSYLKDL